MHWVLLMDSISLKWRARPFPIPMASAHIRHGESYTMMTVSDPVRRAHNFGGNASLLLARTTVCTVPSVCSITSLNVRFPRETVPWKEFRKSRNPMRTRKSMRRSKVEGRELDCGAEYAEANRSPGFPAAFTSQTDRAQTLANEIGAMPKNVPQHISSRDHQDRGEIRGGFLAIAANHETPLRRR